MCLYEGLHKELGKGVDFCKPRQAEHFAQLQWSHSWFPPSERASWKKIITEIEKLHTIIMCEIKVGFESCQDMSSLWWTCSKIPTHSRLLKAFFMGVSDGNWCKCLMLSFNYFFIKFLKTILAVCCWILCWYCEIKRIFIISDIEWIHPWGAYVASFSS